jgi:hypothetical protein
MKLNRRTWLATVLPIALGSMAYARIAAAQDKSARRFVPVYPDHPDTKRFTLNEPGRYVMDDDVIRRRQSGGGHVGQGGGFMVEIGCGSVDIDMKGHTLGADFGMSGVMLSARQNVDFARRFPRSNGPASLDNRLVSLRNGTIDLARGERTGTAVKFTSEWREPAALTGARGVKDCGKWCSPPGVRYEKNEYRFESLEILAHELALAAEGTHTVIRNCVIESAGNAAVFVAGSNLIVENCEIRLRDLARGTHARGRPTRAAIVLRDGSNAIIRNNRIRLDYGGWESDTHCILVRDGARGVVVEDNVFVNVRGEPVHLAEGGEASVRNNRSE